MLKINRDDNGNIVPNRILTILGIAKTEPDINYDTAMKRLGLILNPVPISLFLDTEIWSIPGKILKYKDGFLIE